MPSITFVSSSGAEHEVDAELGYSVAEAAVRNEVPGVSMECGGGCACATCHVLVEHSFFDQLPAAEEMEVDMLEFSDDSQPNSRLSCQLIVDQSFEGLKVTIAEAFGT